MIGLFAAPRHASVTKISRGGGRAIRTTAPSTVDRGGVPCVLGGVVRRHICRTTRMAEPLPGGSSGTGSVTGAPVSGGLGVKGAGLVGPGATETANLSIRRSTVVAAASVSGCACGGLERSPPSLKGCAFVISSKVRRRVARVTTGDFRVSCPVTTVP